MALLSTHTCSSLNGATVLFILLVYLCMREVSASSQRLDLSGVLTDCANIQPRFPAPNTFACYRTRLKKLGPFDVCEADFVRARNLSMTAQSENYTIYYINTPGRLRGRTYANRLLCRYNIHCPRNQQLYLDTVEHNIEPDQQSDLFMRPVCLDYLISYRDFGSQTSCGYRNPGNDLEPNKILLEFRSNQRIRFPGFRMRVVCFDPSLQDQRGCSPTLTADAIFGVRRVKRRESGTEHSPQQDNVETGVPGGGQVRQSLEHFSQDSNIMKRMRRSPDVVKQVAVGKDGSVVYEKKELLVLVNASVVKYAFDNITTVYTVNDFDGVNTFLSDDKRKHFRGFGVLTVVGNIAYYTIYGVDPIFWPSPVEEDVIRMLLEVEEQLIIDEDFIIEEDDGITVVDASTRPPAGSPGSRGPPGNAGRRGSAGSSGPPGNAGRRGSAGSSGPPGSRGKRQSPGSSDMDPMVIGTAQAGANSCNAVVRAVAQSLLRVARPET